MNYTFECIIFIGALTIFALLTMLLICGIVFITLYYTTAIIIILSITLIFYIIKELICLPKLE